MHHHILIATIQNTRPIHLTTQGHHITTVHRVTIAGHRIIHQTQVHTIQDHLTTVSHRHLITSMTKTAEDILEECIKAIPIRMQANFDRNARICAKNAMNEFAAQEVEAYKERLKAFISCEVGANQSSHLLTESQINHIIDAVK